MHIAERYNDITIRIRFVISANKINNPIIIQNNTAIIILFGFTDTHPVTINLSLDLWKPTIGRGHLVTSDLHVQGLLRPQESQPFSLVWSGSVFSF